MNIRTRLMLDLFVDFWTITPLIIGGSLLLLSFVASSGTLLTLGLGFVGFTVAVAFYKGLTNFKSASQAAIEKHAERETKKRDDELDELDLRLQKTKGTQDEEALRNLRSLYDSFQRDIKSKKISENVPYQTIQLIDEIFAACITRLNTVSDLYEQSHDMSGSLKKQITKERKDLIKQVENSVLNLLKTMNDVRSIKFKSQQREMSQLQEKLELQLNVAKEISDISSDSSEYDEYDEEKS